MLQRRTDFMVLPTTHLFFARTQSVANFRDLLHHLQPDVRRFPAKAASAHKGAAGQAADAHSCRGLQSGSSGLIHSGLLMFMRPLFVKGGGSSAHHAADANGFHRMQCSRNPEPGFRSGSQASSVMPERAPVLDGFGDMGLADVFITSQIGDGPGYFQHAMIGPRRPSQARHGIT